MAELRDEFSEAHAIFYSLIFSTVMTKIDNVDIDDVFKDISLTYVNGFRDAWIIISEAIEDMDNFQDEEDKMVFDLVVICNYSYSQAANRLGLIKRKVEYRYRLITNKIIGYLNKKGINNIEDLL